MRDNQGRTERNSVLLSVATWGALWGIFEATAGYLLHLLPFSISWLIWYPVACFFMSNVYRRTGRVSSILWVGLLSASVKLLNLFLPGSIDRVINPTISIVFEAAALAAAIYVLNRFFAGRKRSPFAKGLAALGMNTGWRLLYILYLLLLVPDWIRDVSVISGMDQFIPFFVTQNLITSLLLFVGYMFKPVILKPFEAAEQGILAVGVHIPARAVTALKIGIAAVMVCADVALELLL